MNFKFKSRGEPGGLAWEIATRESASSDWNGVECRYQQNPPDTWSPDIQQRRVPLFQQPTGTRHPRDHILRPARGFILSL